MIPEIYLGPAIFLVRTNTTLRRNPCDSIAVVPLSERFLGEKLAEGGGLRSNVL